MQRNTLNLLTHASASLVAVIAFLIIASYVVYIPALYLQHASRVPFPMCTALLLLGSALIMVLSRTLGERHSTWLSRIAYTTIAVTAALALYMLFNSLQTVQFDVITLLFQESLYTWSGITAAILLIISATLLVLLSQREHQLAIIYGVDTPALFILNFSIFALAAHWRQVPLLDNFGLSFPMSVAFLFASLAILIGTIPMDGLLAPLTYRSPRARFFSIASLGAGFSILAFGIVNITASASYMPDALVFEGLKRLYAFSEIATILVSALVTTFGLRATYFYHEASSQAAYQKTLAAREKLMRQINETIHGTLDPESVFSIITNTLGRLLALDRCLICRIDQETLQVVQPVKEYRASGAVPSMLGVDLSELARKYWLPRLPELPGKPIQYDINTGQFQPRDKEYLERFQIRAGVVCPIRYNNKTIAILLLHQAINRQFTQEELDMAEHIAIQAAIAIHQADLYEEKNRTERQLNQKLNFIRSLTTSLGEGVFATDQEGRVIFINPAAEAMLGWPADEMLNQPLLDKIQPGHLGECISKDEFMRQSGEDMFTRRDGSAFPVAYTATPTMMDNRITGRIFVFHDMTERKMVERELQLYAARLEQSNRDLEKFAYLASHDLQAPLIKLQKFSEILRKIAPLNEESLDIVNRMETSSRRMQELILDILAVARITTSKKPFELVDLNSVVRQVLEDYDETIRKLNARVEVGKLEILEGDPIQLQQLIQNLIDNALKFHRPGVPPEIKIHTRRTDNGQCEIITEDNGIGFKEEYAGRIFQMFERLHGVSTYPGSGIGLAICQKTVEHHHGTITAISKPNQGSTFIATLPCRQNT